MVFTLHVVFFCLLFQEIYCAQIGKTESSAPLSVIVALLQMMPAKNNDTQNLNKAIDFCIKAAAKGADIALMPEMWNVGYTYDYGGYDRNDPSDHNYWLSRSKSVDGDYIQTFRNLAKNLNMAIGVTYLQSWNPLPRNSITLIDRFGNILFTYAKVHTCDWLTSEGSTTSGTDFYTAEMNTKNGNFTIGSMICYDRENPESARILMLKGAELILTPNACYLDELRLSQFRIRAFENSVGVAMANYPSPFYNGNSIAFDHQGNLIVQAGPEEGIYYANFSISALREFRKTSIWGDAFRRPEHYSFLLTQGREPSFTAQNAFDRPRIW